MNLNGGPGERPGEKLSDSLDSLHSQPLATSRFQTRYKASYQPGALAAKALTRLSYGPTQFEHFPSVLLWFSVSPPIKKGDKSYAFLKPN